MERSHLKTHRIILVENSLTGKVVKFEIVNATEMLMYHPDTNEALYKIVVHQDGAEIVALEKSRTPEDAGKCLMECSRGCKGDFVCAAECAVMCATIIISSGTFFKVLLSPGTLMDCANCKFTVCVTDRFAMWWIFSGGILLLFQNCNLRLSTCDMGVPTTIIPGLLTKTF